MARGSDWYSEEQVLLAAVRHSRWTPPVDPGIPGYADWRELRRGGQGVVYVATQLSTQRRVAVKTLHSGPFSSPQGLARFEREIELIAAFQHPQIVRLYDRGLTDQGLPYYVMELIDGIGLDEVLAPRDAVGARAGADPPVHAFPVRQTLELLARICDAVNYAHQRGVIHRDLKPANILLDREGMPYVLDFGLGKRIAAVSGGETRTSLSQTGDFAGSLPWASPEQLDGLPERIDVRTDVYALGVLSYQLLTGRLPYPETAGLRDLITHIRECVPARPGLLRSGIDADVDTIVLKCLSKEPDRRYQTAGEVARDLRHHLAGEPIEAKRDSAIYLLSKRVRRHRTVVALGAALLVVLLAGLITSLSMWSEAASKSDEAARQAAVARAVSAFLQAALEAGDPYAPRAVPGAAGRIGVADVLDVASAKVAAAFAIQPAQEAAVRAVLGATYLQLGEAAKAAPHLERCLALRRELLGERHAETLEALELVAELRDAQGDARECERLMAGVWENRRALLGERHAETLRSLSGLGHARHRLGQEQAAETALRDALRGQTQILGPDHPDTLNSMATLASILNSQERVDEADALARQASDGLRRVLGGGHPFTINSLDPIASLLMAQGQLDEAERLYRDVLDGTRRTLGEDHPDALTSLGNVARVVYEQGRYAEAETLYREELDRMERALSPSHPARCGVLYSLALTVSMQSRFAEAERQYAAALDAARRLLGTDNLLTMQILHGLARVLAEQGRFEEAEPHLREAADGYRRIAGDADPRTLTTLNTLAGLLCDLKRPAEAEPIYRRVLDQRTRTLGSEDPDTLTSLNDLALLLKNLDRPAEAEPLFREVVRIERDVLGPMDRRLLISEFNLAQLLCATGDCDEAASLFADLLQRAPAVLPPEHWYLGWFRLGLGRCLARLGRLGEAEPHLRAAYDLLADSLGRNDRRVRTAAGSVAELYDAWGRVEEAAAWRASSQPADNSPLPPD